MDTQLEEKIRQTIEGFKGVPFVHNGRSKAKGLDCLGFMILFYREFGIKIPDGDGKPIPEHWYREDPDRYIRGIQGLRGTPVSIDNLQPLDLVYFSVKRDLITHTGIMVNNHEFVHMSSHRDLAVDSLKHHWRKFRGAIRLI